MKKPKQSAIRDWLIVLLSLLDDVVVLAFVILALRFFRVGITWPLVIIITLLFAGYVFLMHKLIVPSLHLRKVSGGEGMIGLEGKVVQPLAPVGVVRVSSELWRAKSVGDDIAIGEEVEIVGISDLTLEVRRKNR